MAENKAKQETTGNEVLLTAEGIRRLEEELDELKTVKRQEVAERIKVAIAFGDISENAEYDDRQTESPSHDVPEEVKQAVGAANDDDDIFEI